MQAAHTYDRYQRQLILKGFGAAGQDKLRQGRVLVIGAGGLGCPIIQYLVAAGVGQIGIADHDRVSLSNLHRQILFTVNDIGAYKVEVVRERMKALNPDVDIRIWKEQWSQQHCLDHFPEYDVVVDATDNFATRYLLNDAAVLTGLPLVFGAVSQYEGQVAVFNNKRAQGGRSVNYRDIFPDPPGEGEVLNCAEGGVLGVLPGVIGCLQASEVIKLLTGIGTPLADQLLTYQLHTQSFYTLNLVPNPEAGGRIPASKDAFLAMDYVTLCSSVGQGISEITVEAWHQRRSEFLLLDVREPHEQPRLRELCSDLSIECRETPLSLFSTYLSSLGTRDLVVVCKAGKRSLLAASIIANKWPELHVFSLKGGVDAMIESKIL